MKATLITATLTAGALLGAASLPGPVLAQATGTPTSPSASSATADPSAAAPTLTIGAKVYGPQGEEVGSIDSVTGDAVVINTGANRATLAKASFANGPNGPVIGLTKAQLDAAVEQAKAQSSAQVQAALVTGAEVHSQDGVLVGKIGKVDGDQIVLDRTTGGPVALTRQQFTADAQGLKLVMTAADFEAAANAATASAATTPSGDSTG